MKHKHYDMIVAKAANTDLVVLLNPRGSGWVECECGGFPAFSNGEYFLCLSKHKEACLHWLNGGNAQFRKSGSEESWDDYSTNPIARWSLNSTFMNDKLEVRIKPKKEKRWIAFNKDSGNVYGAFNSYEMCNRAWPDMQKFEIEVEL